MEMELLVADIVKTMINNMIKKIILSILLVSSTAFANKSINYAKAKITYIDFWASWCPPCLASFPWMEQMQQKYKDNGLNIIAINLDEERSNAEKFIVRNPVSFKIRYKDNFSLAEKFRVEAMPSSFIVDNTGKIIYTHKGFNNKAKVDLENKFIELLSK